VPSGRDGRNRLSPNDDRYIGYVLSDIARLLRTVFDRRVRDMGLTRAQWLMLTRLQRRPGASQSELAEMLEIDRASAGRMIDRMEKGGWLQRRADGEDRRVNRLYLTEEARRVHVRMWKRAEATVDDALASLSLAERNEFTRLAVNVKGRLQELAGADAAAPKRAKAAA
jgi:MarR family transcriptional regulator for hemolysin